MDFFLWVVFFFLRPNQQHIYYSTPKKFSCLALLPEKNWSGWWFQPIWKNMLVQMGSSSPTFRGEHKKIFELPPPSDGKIDGKPPFGSPKFSTSSGSQGPRSGDAKSSRARSRLWDPPGWSALELRNSETFRGSFFGAKKKNLNRPSPKQKMPGTPSVLIFFRQFHP